jgi:outer membrane receptor for ferric coprogen and ferric-rhodotorulic acid
VEGGVKTTVMNGRVRFNAAVFWIDWQDLQLNLPDPASPISFYISNVGEASSRGVEFEVNARAAQGVDVFGSFGYTNARFADGTFSSGMDVSDNRIPNTPNYTAVVGTYLSRALTSETTLYGQADITFFGDFKYDDTNFAGQDAYSLTNLRAGARWNRLFVEGWIRNAFDTFYVPVALQYDPSLAPSGFLGESGRPRTFGITGGFRF